VNIAIYARVSSETQPKRELSNRNWKPCASMPKLKTIKSLLNVLTMAIRVQN
jgi:predicted site-specific integrase-resolvase